MTAVERGEGISPARAALAGNPSDGYGGAVLAVTLPMWSARAEATRAEGARIDPDNHLVQATLQRFAREVEPAAANSHIRWSTSIPQRVGLGSSSALVIAVTRALCALHGTEIGPARLAEFALAVETEDLGIVAGLQDRVTQAYGGLLFMEFSEPAIYEQLDRELLPPLVIAWNERAAAHSGGVHADLRRRHAAGDDTLRGAVGELAAAAREARQALLMRDLKGFGACMDATIDLRRRLMVLDPLCLEMVEAARRAGAGTNYTGSGGAIVAACRDQAHSEEVGRALAELGCGVVSV